MTADIQRLNRRLASAQPSATYRIIDRVAERRAQGAQIISLCAGEPDFDTPEHVRAAAFQAIEQGHTRSPVCAHCEKRWRPSFVAKTPWMSAGRTPWSATVASR